MILTFKTKTTKQTTEGFYIRTRCNCTKCAMVNLFNKVTISAWFSSHDISPTYNCWDLVTVTISTAVQCQTKHHSLIVISSGRMHNKKIFWSKIFYNLLWFEMESLKCVLRNTKRCKIGTRMEFVIKYECSDF